MTTYEALKLRDFVLSSMGFSLCIGGSIRFGLATRLSTQAFPGVGTIIVYTLKEPFIPLNPE
jgi:hypothetical protein